MKNNRKFVEEFTYTEITEGLKKKWLKDNSPVVVVKIAKVIVKNAIEVKAKIEINELEKYGPESQTKYKN